MYGETNISIIALLSHYTVIMTAGHNKCMYVHVFIHVCMLFGYAGNDTCLLVLNMQLSSDWTACYN